MPKQDQPKGVPTKFPGVFKTGANTYRLRAQWTDRGRKREICRFEVKAENDRAAALMLEKLKQEVVADTAPPLYLRVSECAPRWLAERRQALDERTFVTYGGAVTHIVHGLGGIYVSEVTRSDVQRWVNVALADEYSPETIRGWLRRLATMMADWGMENVTDRIALPPSEPKNDRLQPGEVWAVLEQFWKIDSRFYPLVAVMALTGLRWCHASAIMWQDIDGNVLRVKRKNVMGKVGPVSRHKRAPEEILLAKELVEILRCHREWMMRRQAYGLESGYCFLTRRGALMTAACALAKRWKKALLAAGITRHVTVHGMRRTFRDLARRADVNARTRDLLTAQTAEQGAEYEEIGRDEKLRASEGVLRLVKP